MYGGGGLSLLGGALYGVMRAQASWARRIIGPAETRPPPPQAVYGPSLPGEPLSVLILGDSAAVGYGMESADDTPPGMIGAGLSHISGRPVRITSMARVGARSSGLADQIDAGLSENPDVAVIVVGTNDVTHRVRPSESVRLLAAAVRRLRAAGCEVVVGTCPDLGSIKPVPIPLRLVAREWSRRLAAAQTIAVVEAGGRSVSLAALLGPSFTAAPGELFGPDRFHPSAAGYASMVAAFLLVYVGIRSYRDQIGGGHVSFGRACAIGMLIVLVSSAIYTATWEVLYHTVYPDFAEKYGQMAVEKARAQGKSAAEIATLKAEMDDFAKSYRNPLFNVAVTFAEPLPVGIIVTLVSAGMLRRGRRDEDGVLAVA